MANRAGIQMGCLILLLGAGMSAQYANAADPSVTAVVGKDDRDSDKTLDWTEVAAAAGARFDKLNKDADGTLDSSEVKGVIGPATFKAADPDNDGTLSKTEYLALVKKLFTQADADKDGTISARELRGTAGHSLKLLIE
jgi:hypothetical protein